MPRRPRIHVPNGFYHVTLRGNHAQPIFFGDADRRLLTEIVASVIDQRGAGVHAYCWMTNHVHLLMQVADDPLGSIVHGIASQYARRVQASLSTTGHLFERRYHAVLVDADSYLLELLRYIHLNPVRAQLCASASEHEWSSHRAYLGAPRDAWVTTAFALSMFHPQLPIARRAYARFIAEAEAGGEAPDLPAANGAEPRVLGDDAFVARAASLQWRPRSHRTLAALISDTCAALNVQPETLASPSRKRRLARV